jgi:hypothetical protein
MHTVVMPICPTFASAQVASAHTTPYDMRAIVATGIDESMRLREMIAVLDWLWWAIIMISVSRCGQDGK